MANFFSQFILSISVSRIAYESFRQCLYKLGALVRFVSVKEVDPTSLETAQVSAVEAVCLLEDTFS
jgi:hypothetical protein